MPKRKYTDEQRRQMGKASKKRKRRVEDRAVYDDEYIPRPGAFYEDDEEEYESGGSDFGGLVLAGLVALLALAIITM